MNLDGIKNSDIALAIDEYIHDHKDRLILKLKLIDGMTHMEISDKLYAEGIQLSERQVKTRFYRAERKLFEYWKLT